MHSVISGGHPFRRFEGSHSLLSQGCQREVSTKLLEKRWYLLLLSCFSIFSLNFAIVISLQVVCPDCSDDIAVKKDNILVRSFKDGKL